MAEQLDANAPNPTLLSPVRLCFLVSAALFGLRIFLAQRVGFGDAEALYVSYALFPQPGYLDHPGLVGFVTRALGGGGLPSPYAVHVLSAIVATLVPWIGGWAAKRAGADTAGACRTILALALVPELSVGLFGLTPDLLLATLWLLALGIAAGQVTRERPASTGFLALGATLGLALLSKVSGGLLAIATAMAMLARPRLRRNAGPYLGAALAVLIIYPWVQWEWSQGAPLLTHRLVATQAEAGPSLRNLGALVGGQLLYVTPPFLLGAWLVARQLFRTRNTDPIAHMLWLCCVIPGGFLALLCLWSKVAEPHWVAPMYLSLAVQLGRMPPLSRGIRWSAAALGGIAVLLALFWVGTDYPPRALGKHYRPRYDLANDLYAWGPGKRLLADVVRQTALEAKRLPVVVGPHWIVCAQAQVAVGRSVRVGCNTPIADDFDRWYPRAKWLRAPTVLYVHDSRFDLDPTQELPGRIEKSRSRVHLRRGGQVVRTLWVTRLDRSEARAIN